MRNGKRQMTEGIELLNQKKKKKKKKIRTHGEKETYTYLGILDADIIKQMEMKEKTEQRKEYLKRTRKLLGNKRPSRNLIKQLHCLSC